jgi:predicted peroxiredoxin
MAEKIVFVATHAKDDPERASYPIMLANAAQSMDVEAVVVLQSDGVFLAQKGYADDISVSGFTPLKQLIDTYVANGGKFLL